MEETQLPPQNFFYDELNDSGISDEEYAHAQKVWNTFEIQTMREYTDIYLKTDVLLLADIFENFRNTSIHLYELDIAHYYTLPGYSWDCMLKFTNVQIELISDIDHLMFVEKSLRGGISQVSNRHCKTNNKYMGPEYDSSKPSNYLLYLDVNNLYGWAMNETLPISDYSWVEQDFSDIENCTRNIIQTADDAEYGYMLEVDLKYPDYLHDQHNDYPFCCEHMMVGGSTEKKLVLTLLNKKKYIIHYRMLKLALRHGLILQKIHKVLRFKQSKWLQNYIMLNTEQRAKCSSDFGTNYFKLMNNAVFGKFLEDIRKHVDVKLIDKFEGRYGLQKLIAKPNFKRNVIFSENLVACELQRLNIYMTKPVLVGVSILEISKCKMYEFHYDFIRKHFKPEQCTIQYTDTDSFLYEFKCDDIFEFIKTNSNQFDTSDFPENNPYKIQKLNKKIVGLMKDEYSGTIVEEFIGLRSKMYTIKTHSNKISKRAKGVKKNILNKKISFEDYKRCLNQKCNLFEKQTTIKSLLHNVFTVTNSKKVLDPFDDKRFIIPNTHSTLAWGHYKISSFENK